jgi:hypothetical protein
MASEEIHYYWLEKYLAKKLQERKESSLKTPVKHNETKGFVFKVRSPVKPAPVEAPIAKPKMTDEREQYLMRKQIENSSLLQNLVVKYRGKSEELKCMQENHGSIIEKSLILVDSLESLQREILEREMMSYADRESTTLAMVTGRKQLIQDLHQLQSKCNELRDASDHKASSIKGLNTKLYFKTMQASANEKKAQSLSKELMKQLRRNKSYRVEIFRLKIRMEEVLHERLAFKEALILACDSYNTATTT